jgi:hypothetical protein
MLIQHKTRQSRKPKNATTLNALETHSQAIQQINTTKIHPANEATTSTIQELIRDIVEP